MNGIKREEKMVDVLVVTKRGNIIRFKLDAIRQSGRGGKGVRAMKLDEGDEIVSMITVNKETNLNRR